MKEDVSRCYATNIYLLRRSPAIVSNPAMLRIFAFLILANSCKHVCEHKKKATLRVSQDCLSMAEKKRFELLNRF